MTRAATEHWLSELQARFGAVLRSPLSAAGGTLHSDPRSYPARAIEDVLPSRKLTAAQRLGVYQRQYWIRLFRLLQEQYPLTTRLCGAWGFNQHATAYLAQHPPRGSDLGSVPLGFAAFLEASVHDDPVRHHGAPPVPRAALFQAARLDAAFRDVFMAPEAPEFRDAVKSATSKLLAAQRLRMSRAFARVQEDWPLLALRARILRAPELDHVALPPAHSTRRTWALYRSPRGIEHFALDREQARLLELLEDHALGHALAILEAESAPASRAGLPARIEQFFARAVERGLFSGFD